MKKLILTIAFLFLSFPAVADEYYIGQWEWNEECLDGEGCWQAPQREKVTGTIDLRTNAQAGLAGGTPQGFALFAYSESVTDARLTHLGGNLDEKPNAKARGAIQTKLGITPNKDSIREIIYELLTEEADPTGRDRWKPLRPGTDRKNKVYFGSEGKIMEVAILPFISPEWKNIQLAIQEDYKHLLKTERHDLVAKWLDYQEEKYDVHYSYFRAPDVIQLASLPHETTITESFNKANSDTLGPDLTWTETEGDYDIVSNAAEAASSPATARAESTLSSDDHYVEVDITEGSGASVTFSGGPIARFVSSGADDFYLLQNLISSDLVRLFKRVGGTFTQIGTAVAFDYTTTHTTRIEVDGSSIKAYVDTVEKRSETDTAVTGNLFTGIRDGSGGGNETTIDNFEAADLSAGAVIRRVILVQ